MLLPVSGLEPTLGLDDDAVLQPEVGMVFLFSPAPVDDGLDVLLLLELRAGRDKVRSDLNFESRPLPRFLADLVGRSVEFRNPVGAHRTVHLPRRHR